MKTGGGGHTISQPSHDHYQFLVGLELADQKTKAVLATSRKVRVRATLIVRNCSLIVSVLLLYLGVQIGARLEFNENVQIASQKAAWIATTIIMPKIDGPCQDWQRLLSTVARCTMLYMTPIWVEAMVIKTNTHSLAFCAGFLYGFVQYRNAAHWTCGGRMVQNTLSREGCQKTLLSCF